MKKVLFIVSTFGRSGPTQQLFFLCKHLPKYGYTPVVLTLSPDPSDNLAHLFYDAHIEHHTLGLSRVKGLFMAAKKTRQIIDQIQPDIIHSSGIRGDAIGHKTSGATPHIMTIRNSAWDDYPKKFGALKGGLMAFNHLKLVKNAQMPIACSKTLATQLERYRADFASVPNGIDTEVFRPLESNQRLELKTKLGLNPDKKIILSVGALIPRKQPENVIEAFLASDVHKVADLYFLGDGPLSDQLKTLAQGHPSIIFAGQVNNVRQYLQASDLLVSTSRSEGLPNSVLEALAIGVPALLSDIGPHIELSVEEYEAGLLAGLGDISDFAAKMELMISQDTNAYAKNSRHLAESKFSADKTANQYAKIYDELI